VGGFAVALVLAILMGDCGTLQAAAPAGGAALPRNAAASADTQNVGAAADDPKFVIEEERDADASGSTQDGIAAIVAEAGVENGGMVRFGDALGTVWRTNPQVTQAELAFKATDYEVSGSRTGYFPYVSVQQEQDKDGNSGIVRVIQPLWNGGLTSAQVDGARADQMQALAELNSTRLDLGQKTAEAYLNLVTAKNLAIQWLEYLNELNRLLKVIERRAGEGVAAQSDVDTARTRVAQAKAGYESNRALIESNRAQLTSLINRMPSDVDWPDERHILSEDESRDAGRAGISAHPARQRAIANYLRQSATARASKAQLWPQVNAEYRRALQDFSSDSGNDDTALLTFQYQTDNGLKGYQQYKADEERMNSAKASLEAADREIGAAIRSARAERDAARIQMKVQAEAVESSRALVDSFLRQFEAGRKTWLEVLNTLREYNDTVLQSINIKRGFWIANTKLGLQGLYWKRLSDSAPTIDVIHVEGSSYE
jgi:outer membrane protein TolC